MGVQPQRRVGLKQRDVTAQADGPLDSARAKYLAKNYKYL